METCSSRSVVGPIVIPTDIMLAKEYAIILGSTILCSLAEGGWSLPHCEKKMEIGNCSYCSLSAGVVTEADKSTFFRLFTDTIILIFNSSRGHIRHEYLQIATTDLVTL